MKNGKCECGYSETKIVYGDMNGDKVINATDTALLSRAIGGAYKVEADVFADGKIDQMDVETLRSYIAGGYIKELPHTCGTYTVTIKEINKDSHETSYKCKCGAVVKIETAKHEYKGGKCECGATELKEGVFYGDANNDGIVSTADLVLFSRRLLGDAVTVIKKNCDLYKDDRFDVFDLIKMREIVIKGE
jgi:hypothetical protein